MTRMNVEGNGDGQISAAEHAAGADKRFEMMDADKDGKVTAAEIDASHGAESAAWAKHQMSSADKIRKLDSDNDGALTRAEYADGSQKMFSKLDVDGDGNLTAAEMSAGHEKGDRSRHGVNAKPVTLCERLLHRDVRMPRSAGDAAACTCAMPRSACAAQGRANAWRRMRERARGCAQHPARATTSGS